MQKMSLYVKGILRGSNFWKHEYIRLVTASKGIFRLALRENYIVKIIINNEVEVFHFITPEIKL